MRKPLFITTAALLVTFGLSTPAPAQLKAPEDAPTPASMGPFIEMMEKYLYLVDHLSRLSENPTASGVAAVLNANDLLKGNPQSAIDYFNKVLPDVNNPSVRRAIRIQLADLYKNTNQQEKALEQLRELMVSAPAGGTPRMPPPQPPRGAQRPAPPPPPTDRER